jgi:hypothetical protein
MHQFRVSPLRGKYLHYYIDSLNKVEIYQSSVEVPVCNTSTERGSNLALFNEISKSGESRGSGDIVPNLMTGCRYFNQVHFC